MTESSKPGKNTLRLRNRELELQLVETVGQIKLPPTRGKTGSPASSTTTKICNREQSAITRKRSEAFGSGSTAWRVTCWKKSPSRWWSSRRLGWGVTVGTSRKHSTARPISTGQVLLEVSTNLRQPYHLELNMPENVSRSRREQPTDAGSGIWPSSEFLATEPDTTLHREDTQSSIRTAGQAGSGRGRHRDHPGDSRARATRRHAPHSRSCRKYIADVRLAKNRAAT